MVQKHIIFHILYIIVAPLCSAFLKRIVSRHDETKTIKPIINEAFVAFNEDIITDYNDYTVFLRIAPTAWNTPKTKENMKSHHMTL